MSNVSSARSAFLSLDAGCSREEWVSIGMSAKAAGLLFEDFHSWSQNAENYKSEKDCKSVWGSFSEHGGVTEATLFDLARKVGWSDPVTSHINEAHNGIKKEKAVKNSVNQIANSIAVEVWKKCLLATFDEAYISRKQGNPDGLRVYPFSAPSLVICGQNVAGYLVVPCWSNEMLQTLQFIPPDKGDKLNLPGASFNDGFFTVGGITGCVYICEGIGQAWAIYKATGKAAVVCFGVGRMLKVAKLFNSKYPKVNLTIVSDRGKEKQAAEIAAAVEGQWVEMPSEKDNNYDANDYMQEYGSNELAALLEHVKYLELPLSVIFAEDLPDVFEPPDELVEGMLTAGDGSILYGDSNSGKTFFVIDIACAVARGTDWMGRKTEPGLVIYLAAESPASVKRRLQAYQKHHKVQVMNFAIAQSPINFFDGDADTDAVIQLIHLLEGRRGQKVRLIIGDTLARLSSGANENAGQDMGLVVRRFDRIRTECNAHFMLIHHSGKSAAAGARGWSGIRAAVDTEIEVTDSPAGRCAEITKQRDLSTKGVRIGFRLESIMLGLTKWKDVATSCVVVPADAPQKKTGKRPSEISGAIKEYLIGCGQAIKKKDLISHFIGRYDKSSVYRELKKLVEVEAVKDSLGYVSIENQDTPSMEVPIGAN